MSTSSTEEAVRANTSYHARIIATIAELDYIPSALSHQTSYVKDLEIQLRRSKERLTKLEETTMKERKEHQNLRDSTARRLAHKLTGRREKFEARESKEEREYVEALEKEFAERDSQILVQQMLDEARQAQMELLEQAARYESSKKELSDLYLRIFEGPTEDFPEDDRLEYELQLSQTSYDQTQNMLNVECQAAEILGRADKTLTACKAKVKEALGYSQWDMWGGGGMSDMMERNALSMAQSLANQTELLCHQAQNTSPFVQPIGRLSIAQGSLMSDVFFDNIFTDMAFHRKITASATELERVHSRLKMERDAAQRRGNEAGNNLIEVSQTLDANRLALDTYRREIFQQVAREHGPPSRDLSPAAGEQSTPLPEQPPSYNAAFGFTEATSILGSTPPREVPPSASDEPISIPGAFELESTFAPSTVQRPVWGSRNPYAAALATRAPPFYGS